MPKPKSTLILKSAVIKHDQTTTAEIAGQSERLRQSERFQAAEATEHATGTTVEDVSGTETEPAAPKPNQDLQGLQNAFLSANLNKAMVCYLMNGIKLTGRLRQFDQFSLLLEDSAPMLVFKHAICTLAPSSR